MLAYRAKCSSRALSRCRAIIVHNQTQTGVVRGREKPGWATCRMDGAYSMDGAWTNPMHCVCLSTSWMA